MGIAKAGNMGLAELLNANQKTASLAEMLRGMSGSPVAVSMEYPDDKRLHLLLIGPVAVIGGRSTEKGTSPPYLIITAEEHAPVYLLTSRGFVETQLGWSGQLITPIAGDATIATGDGIKGLLKDGYGYTGQLPEPIARAVKT